MAGIADGLDAAFKVLEFLGRVSFGPQQMGDPQDGAYKTQREYELDTYREITNG
jgi:hypothetical protein